MVDSCQCCSRVKKDGHVETHWICSDCRVGEDREEE